MDSAGLGESQSANLGDFETYKDALFLHYGLSMGVALTLLLAYGFGLHRSRSTSGNPSCLQKTSTALCLTGLALWALSCIIVMAYVGKVGGNYKASLSELNPVLPPWPPATGDPGLAAAVGMGGGVQLVLAFFLVLAAMGFPGPGFFVFLDPFVMFFIAIGPIIQTGVTSYAVLSPSFAATTQAKLNYPTLSFQCALTTPTAIQVVVAAITAMGGLAFLIRRAVANCLNVSRGSSAVTAAVSTALWFAFMSPVWTVIGGAALGCGPLDERLMTFLAKVDGFQYTIAVEVPRLFAFLALVIILLMGGGADGIVRSDGSAQPAGVALGVGPGGAMSPREVQEWKPSGL